MPCQLAFYFDSSCPFCCCYFVFSFSILAKSSFDDLAFWDDQVHVNLGVTFQ